MQFVFVKARVKDSFVVQMLLMSKQYNQWRAMLAITTASLKSILRSPSAVVFSIAFPLIFILVFGFIGGNGTGTVYKIVLSADSDTSNALYYAIKQVPIIKIIKRPSSAELEKLLIKGRITGELSLQKNTGIDSTMAPYMVKMKATTASSDKIYAFLPILENIVAKIDKSQHQHLPTYAKILPADIASVREYRTIDFILPGQLGFSLLSSGVFGVAFLFFNLRQALVLKRFFATPIKRTYIVLGESLARVIFQLMTAIIIIGIGHFAFQFTLVNGLVTFLEIMVLSFIALLVFMGLGFIVSSLAKNESSIPPFANLITLPQFLLAGTFFSIEAFPAWLQPVCRVLPLTHFNDAMRKIAFEGAHLSDCGPQLLYIGIWGVVVYIVAVKVFRWE